MRKLPPSRKTKRTLWLIEVLYTIKIGKLYAKNQSQKRKKLKVLFETDIRDIVAYRGNICIQEGSPWVNWITWRLHAKNEGPKSRDEKVISLCTCNSTEIRAFSWRCLFGASHCLFRRLRRSHKRQGKAV